MVCFSPLRRPAAWLFAAMLVAPHADAKILLRSAFDANSGAAVLPGNADNQSGSATVEVTDWIKHPSVTSLSGLTAISTGNGGTQGGFARLQNGAAAYAGADNLFINRNHSLDLDRSTSKRGFSFTFTIRSEWTLGALTVQSGHTNASGNTDQSYGSELVCLLEGAKLPDPITASSQEDYGQGSAYHAVAFDLSGKVLPAGTYTLSIYQTRMTGSGAYAIYNGIALEGENGELDPPVISSFTADRVYVSPGGSVTFSWQTEGADSLSISPDLGDVMGSTEQGNGSQSVEVRSTCTYVLTASSSAGSATRVIEVTVGPPRPNLVLILADDYGIQDSSVPFCLGSDGKPTAYQLNNFYKTPNLEKLAEDGMRFTSAYAQTVCSPTRCGLMTGRNSVRHAVTDWVGGGGDGAPANWRSAGLDGTEVTLPKLLHRAGYRTIHVGKGHFSKASVPITALGFDMSVGGGHWGHPPSGYIGTPGYGRLPGLEDYDGSIYLTRALGIEAKKALETAVSDGRPFFLNLAFYATHAPFTVDPDAKGEYSGALNAGHRAFATMGEGMDLAIGAVRQKLVDLGVAENTMIVFLGDNGSDSPAATVNGLASGRFSDFPLRGKKGSKWEGGARVPLIFTWAAPNPDNPFQRAIPISANGIATDIVASWDVPVTFLAAAGVTGEDGFGEDGYDLSGYLSGAPANRRPQELVMHYPHVHGSRYYSWIRQSNLKLIYNYEFNSHQLYDLAEDPTESHDLAAERPAEVVRLSRRLARDLDATWGTRGPLIPTIATIAPNGNVVSIPVSPAIDSDDDGIPDIEEDPNLNGLPDVGETDPENEDTDGDGSRDGVEQRTGTDALDATSSFRATPRLEDDRFVLSWPSKPGALYRVESSGTLREPWDLVADDVSASEGDHTAFDAGPLVERKFYRIVLK